MFFLLVQQRSAKSQVRVRTFRRRLRVPLDQRSAATTWNAVENSSAALTAVGIRSVCLLITNHKLVRIPLMQLRLACPKALRGLMVWDPFIIKDNIATFQTISKLFVCRLTLSLIWICKFSRILPNVGAVITNWSDRNVAKAARGKNSAKPCTFDFAYTILNKSINKGSQKTPVNQWG